MKASTNFLTWGPSSEKQASSPIPSPEQLKVKQAVAAIFASFGTAGTIAGAIGLALLATPLAPAGLILLAIVGVVTAVSAGLTIVSASTLQDLTQKREDSQKSNSSAPAAQIAQITVPADPHVEAITRLIAKIDQKLEVRPMETQKRKRLEQFKKECQKEQRRLSDSKSWSKLHATLPEGEGAYAREALIQSIKGDIVKDLEDKFTEMLSTL